MTLLIIIIKKERLLISLDGGFVDLIGFGDKALEEGFFST
jgi:hypothetical protein